MLQHCGLVLGSESDGLYVGIQSLRAQRHDCFRCSFDVDADELLVLLTVNLPNHDLPLQILIEWQLDYLRRGSISIYENILDILIIIHQKLNHADLKSLSLRLILVFESLSRHFCLINFDADIRI